MLRSASVRCDIWQVNFGLLLRAEFDFRLLRGLSQALHRQRIRSDVNAALTLELGREVFDNTHVEVFTTEERIAVGRKYFELMLAVHFGDFNDRDVESTATEVEDCDRGITTFLVHAIGKCCRCRLVDNAFDIESGDLAGVFGRLSLRVVEVSGDRDNGFCDFFTKIILSGLLHFHENPS